MKQENGKKSKLWLWIVLALVAVLAVAGVIVGMMFMQPGETPTTAPTEATPESEVYWNIDKAKFTEDSETGLSTREKEADGLYHFRMVSQGQMMDLATADKQLVNFIDTMDACGLVFDADGLIIDVLDVKTIAVETAKSFYVKKISGTTVTVNSSIAMNGMDITFEVGDSTFIMDVRPNTETLGQKVELNVMDVVCVYGNEENPAVSIFLMERPESSPLYLRVDRLYSSAEASTTRVPDENGVYTIPFAINGKVEQLKCKDKAIVTGIDSGTDAKQVMGLTFDEEGYINGTILAATAARGKLACQVYNVTAMNGNAIEATRILSGSEQGKVVNFTLTEDTQIIINEADCGHFIGERMPTLEMDDRVVVWTDMDNNALYIKIDRRRVYGDDIAMYYNFKKQYDSTNKVTKRVPDASGYYVFELASGGKVVTVKTKDKDLATKIDADSYQFFALKVQKGIVKEFYTKDCLTGGYGIGGQRFVAQVMGTIVRIVSGSDFNSGGNYIMTPNTEVYLMTQYPGAKIGSKTTLQEGDRVIAARNIQNEITHIYVLDRVYSGTKLYYNASRKYNSTTQETSRTPDAEGYYVFDVFCEGKALQVKTKSKDIATAIDLQNAPIVAMKVSNGIVKAAYPAIAHAKYTNKVFNYNYVNELTANKELSCYYFSGGERFEAAGPWKLASNCKIYNVSNDYNSHRGEKTSTVKPGDRIQALRNLETGEITHIWILGRLWDSPLYINPARKYNSTTKETTRVPNEEGYYEVELFVDGKMKTFKTKDKAVMSVVDSNSSETVFAMKTNGNIILKADTYTSSKRGMNSKASFVDVMKVSGSSITLERKRPGQSNTGAVTELALTSKVKVYDVGYYSGEDQYKAAKLKKGDRVSVYADQNNEVTYIFIWYRSMHEKGYESKCPHCNKVVWWEPFTGSFINTALDQVVHYYQPADYQRSNQASVGVNVNTNKTVPRFTAVFDMNGKTLTTTGGRNFLVYFDLIIIDTVGGGVLESNGYQGGGGGNFMIQGGTVTVNDGVTIRQNDDPAAKASNGGNFVVSNLTETDTGKVHVGKIVLNDAKLEAWDCDDGGNIKMNAGTELIIKKATITGGDISVHETATVKLDGKVQIGDEGIILNDGAKIKESKLTAGSKVIVQANGIFTEKWSNVNEQKAYYEAERKFYPIEVKDGALWTDRDPSKPDYVKEPAVPALPELLKVDNTALALDANGQAKCPVCDKVVTWTAINDSTAYELGNNNHYYLPADVTFEKAEAPYIQVPAGQVACLHLNDHNITATNAQAVSVNGTLSIMGNGTVSGNGYASFEVVSSKRPDLHAATVEVNSDKAVLNLYGGTYVKSDANDSRMVEIVKGGVQSTVSGANHVVNGHGNGGTINMFEGAVIDARNTKKNGVMSYWGEFKLYGGTVYGGTGTAVAAGNWTDAKSGRVSIFGGTIQAGSGASVNASGIKTGPATLNIYGGQINGGAFYNANCKFTLAGNPVFTTLNQPSNKDGAYEGKIILGKLTEGAVIPIKGTEEISFQNENAADYVKYFKSLTGIDIVHQNYAVSFYYVPDPELPELPEVMPAYGDNLQFIGETTWALCPVCEEYVKWTPITQKEYGENAYNNGSAVGNGTHIYLAEDVTYTGTSTFINAPGKKSDTEPYNACFHLNGHSFTATSSNVAHGSHGNLNFLGTGTMSGNGKNGATITINTSHEAGGMYLYSGTYTKVSGNNTGVIQVNSNGGRIVVMKDATVVTKEGHLAAKVSGGNLISGYMVINGTIEGGYVESTLVNANKKGEIVLELNGANIEGGVKVAEDTVLGIFGETKIDGMDLSSGAKIAMSELTGEAKITVKANGAFSAIENATAQLPYYAAIKGYFPVEVKENNLWTSDDPAVPEDDVVVEPDIPADPTTPALPTLLKVDNSNLNLVDGKAVCPVCAKEVEWTAITEVTENSHGYEFVGDGHYYLANDITYEVDKGTAMGIWYNSAFKGKPVCLHLNGHNITATKGLAIFGGMELNIMGNGIVSGNKTANNEAATLQLNSAGAIVNVYGGTYIKDASNTAPIVNIGVASGKLSIYEGVVVGKPDFSTGRGNSVQGLNGVINVYGGTIYGGASGYCLQAGSYSDKYCAVNIFDGLLQAKAGGGAACNGGSTLNFYGGVIKGTTNIAAGANVIIGGTAQLNRLDVKNGAKITMGVLKDGASITVIANGIFTNPSENAAKYVQYFHGFKDASKTYKTPTVVEKALFTELGAPEQPDVPDVPDVPVVPEGPTVPALPELLKVDNANLTLDSASKAECPVCKKTVEWIAITDASAVQTLEGGKHYVLTADLTHEAAGHPFIQAPSDTASCLHLNGHNITATNAMAILVNGKLNIMGNGNVSGNGYSSADLSSNAHLQAATIQVNKKTAVLNLYGGTYIKSAANDDRTVSGKNGTNHIVGVHGNGGTINMFEGAIVDGRNYKGNSLRGFFGMFNLYGGTVYGSTSNAGSFAVIVGNWSATNSGSAQIFGGSITAFKGTALNIGATETAPASLGIYGGVISGTTNYNAHAEVTIAGNPVMNRLNVPTNKNGAFKGLVTIGEMTEGASIAVNGTGVFTNPVEKADSYLTYFKAFDAKKEVKIVDKTFSVEEKTVVEPDEPETPPVTPEEPKDINANLVFTSGNKAVCGVCKKEVEWTPITMASLATSGDTAVAYQNVTGLHYYLAEDINYAGELAYFFQGPTSHRTMCIHLNGHNFTGTSAKTRFLFGNGSRTSVMGNGIVASGYDAANCGGLTWNTNSNDNYINLYGGTYTVTPANTKGSPIAIQENGGVYNIYKDVKVIGSATAPAIYVGKAQLAKAMLNIEGATIEGNIVIAEAKKAEGSKYLSETAGISVVTLKDTKVNGVTLNKNVTFTVAGATVIEKLEIAAGAKITLGELTSGASIAVAANGTFSEASANAAQYVKYFKGCEGYKTPVVKENALFIEEGIDETPKPEAKPVATVGGQNISDEVWAEILRARDVQKAAKELDPKTATTCPACGATNITWTAADGKVGENKTDNSVAHFYIDAETTVVKQYNWATLHNKNQTLCLLLKNGDTAKEIGGLIGARGTATGATINIMGEGILTSNGTATGDAQFGVVCLQGNTNTLNLYGGTFIYTGDGEGRAKDANGKYQPNGIAYAAAVTLKGYTNTINMYEDVVVGPEKQDLTKPCYNVRIEVGKEKAVNTFNMYGGIIRNGVTKFANTSGNLHLHYNYTAKTDTKPASGYLATMPTFNMYGGLIANGNHVEGTDAFQGGNAYFRAGSQVNILGGTISGGKAVNGGNVYIDISSLTVVNINGGTITGGQATNGGNIQTKAEKVTIGEYALIKDGVAEVYGGNIQIKGGALTTSGHIMNGKAATAGGNIDVQNFTLTINGGVIANGSVTNATSGAQWGGNVRAWNGHVVMNDGLVYGGTRISPNNNTANVDANNIGVKGEKSATPSFTMNGGTVVGDIGFSAFKAAAYEVDGVKKDFPGTAVKISGNAKIVTSLEVEGKTVTAVRGISVSTGNEMDVSGMTAEAKIAVTSAKDRKVTKAFDGIAALKDCFILTDAAANGTTIALNETDKVLYIAAVQPEVTEPALVKMIRGIFN